MSENNVELFLIIPTGDSGGSIKSVCTSKFYLCFKSEVVAVKVGFCHS